jgi:hypothetical protein
MYSESSVFKVTDISVTIKLLLFLYFSYSYKSVTVTGISVIFSYSYWYFSYFQLQLQVFQFFSVTVARKLRQLDAYFANLCIILITRIKISNNNG